MSDRLSAPTLVMSSVMAVASIGRSDTGVVPDERLDIRGGFLTHMKCDVRHAFVQGYALVPSLRGSVMIERTASPQLGCDLLDRPLPHRVHQVRRSLLDSAVQDLGLAVTAADITVIDVLEPEPPLGSGLPTGGGT
ncbi:hypothetical protein GCM10027162_33110 [Streptomyces incanus]